MTQCEARFGPTYAASVQCANEATQITTRGCVHEHIKTSPKCTGCASDEESYCGRCDEAGHEVLSILISAEPLVGAS